MAATRDSSNLLAHEAAFALGQMQELEAIPALASVLNDLSLHPIVRHEVSFHVFNFLFILGLEFFFFAALLLLLVFITFETIDFIIIA